MYFAAPGEGSSTGGFVKASSTGGGEVGSECVGFSGLSLLLSFFLRRWRQKRMSERIAIRAARPPTTPPAIAPTLVLLEPGDGVMLPVWMVRVAVRAEKDGISLK